MGPDKTPTDGAAFGNQVDDLFAVVPDEPADSDEVPEGTETEDGEEKEEDGEHK